MINTIKSFRYVKEKYSWREIWIVGLVQTVRTVLTAGYYWPAVRSLYPCSEVCVRVGRVKSWPFTVGVGLRQGCVLSPLLFGLHQWFSTFSLRGAKARPIRFCWRVSLKIFNTIQLTRFVLQQNDVCYTKY